MKYLIILLLIIIFVPVCFADRVCIEKQTGKLIEYQSLNAPLGILTKNAISAGYKAEDVEEKYITQEEWTKFYEEQIIKPLKEKEKKDKINKEAKKNQTLFELQQELDWTDKQIEKLKEAIND